MVDVQPPPLRTLDDFVSGSARFAVPDVRDVERWNNRIINNLLYYQSNYFVYFLAFLVTVGYLYPLDLLLGVSVVTGLFVAFLRAAETQAAVCRFRRSHPSLALFAILLLSYLLLSVLGGVNVFLCSIALPVLLILVHASVRLRSLKNKVENKLESIGLRRTPMGLLLEALGQEQEAGS
ncbi:PRA1 family protein 2 [Aplochiton taeniatus]